MQSGGSATGTGGALDNGTKTDVKKNGSLGAKNGLKTASRVETLGVWAIVLRIVAIMLLSTRRFSLFEWYYVP